MACAHRSQSIRPENNSWHFAVTLGLYDDDGPGEIFLKMSKQGMIVLTDQWCRCTRYSNDSTKHVADLRQSAEPNSVCSQRLENVALAGRKTERCVGGDVSSEPGGWLGRRSGPFVISSRIGRRLNDSCDGV